MAWRMLRTAGWLALLLGPAATFAAEPDIAVLDIARIFEGYQMTRDLEVRFDDKRRAATEEAQTRRNNIEQMRSALAAFDPTSEDFAKREAEMQRAETEYEVWSSVEEKRLKAEHKRWLMQIYRNTQAVVGQVAEERGIDLVLTYDQLADDAPDSLALRQQILLQKVIYHSARVDVTDEVLRRLNDAYKAHGGAASLEAPPTGADAASASPKEKDRPPRDKEPAPKNATPRKGDGPAGSKKP
jgi:Skp family chaperone for outer membrane proteins